MVAAAPGLGGAAERQAALGSGTAAILVYTAFMNVWRWSLGWSLMNGAGGDGSGSPGPTPMPMPVANETQPLGVGVGGDLGLDLDSDSDSDSGSGSVGGLWLEEGVGRAGEESSGVGVGVGHQLIELGRQRSDEGEAEGARGSSGTVTAKAERGRRSQLQGQQGGFSETREEVGTSKSKSKSKGKWVQCKSVLQQALCNAPVVSALLALLLAAATPLRPVLFDEDATLRPMVTDSVKTLGEAYVACAILVLGAGLAKVPAQMKLPWRTTAVVGAVRLVVMPALAAAALYWAVPLLGGTGATMDPAVVLVLLLESAGPPAINLGVMANLAGYKAEETAALLFWLYLIAALTLTGWCAVFVAISFG